MGFCFGIASVAAAGAQTNKGLSLTVNLLGQYDPNLTVCTRVRSDEPFVVVLTNGKIETNVSGKLQRHKKQRFTLELAVAQGNSHGWIFDRLIYQLELGVRAKGPEIVETRNHPSGPKLEDLEITLARGSCPSA
jgi:hypothetical protein